MTPREAAKHYGVSIRTIRRWCATGQVPAVCSGGRWDIDPAANTRPTPGQSPATELTEIREELAQLKGLWGGQIAANLDRRLTDLAEGQAELVRELQAERALLRQELAAVRKELAELRVPWWRRWGRK